MGVVDLTKARKPRNVSLHMNLSPPYLKMFRRAWVVTSHSFTWGLRTWISGEETTLGFCCWDAHWGDLRIVNLKFYICILVNVYIFRQIKSCQSSYTLRKPQKFGAIFSLVTIKNAVHTTYLLHYKDALSFINSKLLHTVSNFTKWDSDQGNLLYTGAPP